MSKYADTQAGHAYAKLDALDLNHINSRSTQMEALAVLKRHPGQAVFAPDASSSTPKATSSELGDRMERRVAQLDKYHGWKRDAAGCSGDMRRSS